MISLDKNYQIWKGVVMNLWPTQSEVDIFYGNPRGKDGIASKKWESENIIAFPVPWKLVTAWDFAKVSKIRMHKKCADSLLIVLNKIWEAAGQNQAKIDEWGMNLYAGGYNFRQMRGSTKLSMHSWGCAIDFDSDRNSFGDPKPNFGTIPIILEAFASEGWIWGGVWDTPDGMHWQAAIV